MSWRRALPAAPAARKGGIRVEDAWRKAKGLFKAVQRDRGAGEGGCL